MSCQMFPQHPYTILPDTSLFQSLSLSYTFVHPLLPLSASYQNSLTLPLPLKFQLALPHSTSHHSLPPSLNLTQKPSIHPFLSPYLSSSLSSLSPQSTSPNPIPSNSPIYHSYVRNDTNRYKCVMRNNSAGNNKSINRRSETRSIHNSEIWT